MKQTKLNSEISQKLLVSEEKEERISGESFCWLGVIQILVVYAVSTEIKFLKHKESAALRL